ncbi:MAG: hypothetical protein WCA49_01505 [Candidatus Sulfotelmatobacter sp.]
MARIMPTGAIALNAEEFRSLLLSTNVEDVVQQQLFDGPVYAFRQRPGDLDVLKLHLVSHLPLTADGIVVVGSAKTGFSLSPESFPRPFSIKSDIDVVVVDEALFDTYWAICLEYYYPRRIERLPRPDYEWLQRRKGDVFWGRFEPHYMRYEGLSFPEVLRPLRDLSTAWFNAFRSLSTYGQFRGRDIKGRLYRSWNLALAYHADGLRQIKQSLRKEPT